MIERLHVALAVFGAICCVLILGSWTAFLWAIWRACARTATGVERLGPRQAATKATIGYAPPGRVETPAKGSDDE